MAPFLDKRERAEEVAKLSRETWKPILNHETKHLQTHRTWKPIQNTETWKTIVNHEAREAILKHETWKHSKL